MILQALYEYYLRKSADPENTEMAPLGWQWKEIPFVLVLNKAGELVAVDNCRVDKKRARLFLLPQEVKRTGGVASNLLWDKPSYIWGYDPLGKPERTGQQREAFLGVIQSLPQEDEGIQAVLRYLSDPQSALTQAQAQPEWKDIAENAPFMAIRLDGDEDNRLVCQRPRVREAIDNAGQKSDTQQTCLVTGNPATIARLHTAIKGIPGAQTSGAPLVSFNATAFTSYGLEQGNNAPVGEAVVDGYTKALNHLLRKDSKQKFRAGNTTMVFWARKDNDFESSLDFFLGGEAKDDPDAYTRSVLVLLNSPHKGGAGSLEKDNFYLLGLSPNAARLSVRFWLPTTVEAAKSQLCRYFGEIKLDGGKMPYPPLRSLLSSLALEYKLDNLSPLLEGAVLFSIFSGARYPETLLVTALARMRAEQNLPHLRAALIKAYLIRNCKKEIPMSLDENAPEEAYHIGRLFAVLEKTQEEAMGNINATIRDRFFGAASTRPAAVFPTLLKLHMHHLKKLENRGRANNLEKLVGGIMGHIASSFASPLSLEQQGIFAIGYYHQRQALFTKAADKQEPEAA